MKNALADQELSWIERTRVNTTLRQALKLQTWLAGEGKGIPQDDEAPPPRVKSKKKHLQMWYILKKGN